MITGTQFFLGKHHLQGCLSLWSQLSKIGGTWYNVSFFKPLHFKTTLLNIMITGTQFFLGKHHLQRCYLLSCTIKLINLNRHHLIYLKMVKRINWSKKGIQLYTSKTEQSGILGAFCPIFISGLTHFERS